MADMTPGFFIMPQDSEGKKARILSSLTSIR
jgi:hypothetical protein